MKRSALAVEMALQISGQQNVITIPRVFVKLMEGDIAAAAVLSQSLYWWDKVGRREFYKVDDEWEQEIGVSAKQMQRIRSKLSEYGVLSQRKGVPAKMHYSVDTELLENLLRRLVETVPAQREKQESTVSENYIQKTTSVDYAEDYAEETPPPTGGALSTREPEKPTLTTSASSPDWYLVTYNKLKPRSWKGCEVINTDRKRKLKAFIGEYKDRSPDIFKAALIYVARDPWWSKKNLSFDTLFTKNHITQFAEGAADALSKGVDPAQSEMQSTYQNMLEALN